MIMANVMFSAPYRDVKRAALAGKLGDLNPTPWAFMLFNCLGWVTYAILINNLFVFFGNVFALVLSVWLNMVALELKYADYQSVEIRRSIVLALRDSNSGVKVDEANELASPFDYAKIVWDVAALNTKPPVTHKTIIMFLTMIWTTLLCIICLVQCPKELVIGIAVNLNLVFFYGAPLSTIFTVIKTRSCSSIHPMTMYTMFSNGLFWAAFGFAVVDWFIAIPNSLGALLGAVQIILCIVYPRAAAGDSKDLSKSVAKSIETDDYEIGVDASDKDGTEPAHGDTQLDVPVVDRGE
ncbi:hypothetical protein MPSEU_000241600 [Mayamaea pseudoterrestris]|nr:hypothetical protein MPSEU_000241600 [Mayamaea pseudoterrestris]